jgi:mediator of RNA polymerase II transcription subunit 7
MDEEIEDEEKTYENYALPPPPPYYKHFTEKNLQRLKDLTEAAKDGDAATKASTLLDLPPELRCLLPPDVPEDGIVNNFGEPKTVRVDNSHSNHPS